jgi:hypothetical protein
MLFFETKKTEFSGQIITILTNLIGRCMKLNLFFLSNQAPRKLGRTIPLNKTCLAKT